MLLALIFGLLSQAIGQKFLGVEEMRLFQYSQIEHDTSSYQSYSIKEGKFLVFQFISDNSGEPGNHSIAESIIAFQVKNGLDDFELKGEELSEHQAVYIQRCRCQDRGIQLIHSGEIHGKKLSTGNWNIEGEVEAMGRITGKTYHLPLNGEFKESEE